MKAVFFGTPNYATASIRALLDAGIDVPLICTRPPGRAGRGRMANPTPVANFGDESGIRVFAPERLDTDAAAEVSRSRADVFVVVAYGRFIPAELLAMPRLGVLNVHPSLLPKHRGPSPVATAILEGDQFTGATIMMLDEGMDTGPILMQSPPIEIGRHEKCDGLTERLFEVGARMLPEVLDGLASGALEPVEQDHESATVTSLIRKEDGEIDWADPADLIVRKNRAFHPWPGTSTTLNGQPFKVIDAEVADVDFEGGVDASGTVFQGDDGGVFVTAGGSTLLKLITVQAAGRRAMSVHDFALGRPDFIGSQLGA